MNKIEYKKMFEAEDSHWWYVSLHDLIGSFLAREKESKGLLNILDAGCGTGRLCQRMTSYGTVSGCDNSESALAFCKERKISSVFQADLNQTEIGRELYDVVTSIDVLCQGEVTDDFFVLRKLFDSLKPDGILILQVPSYLFLRSRHDMAVHAIRRYTKSSVYNMLKDSGFIIEKISYRICFLFLPIVLYRLLQKPFMKYMSAHEVSSDVSIPPASINRILLKLCMLENSLIERIYLPFGTSTFALARKPKPGRK